MVSFCLLFDGGDELLDCLNCFPAFAVKNILNICLEIFVGFLEGTILVLQIGVGVGKRSVFYPQAFDNDAAASTKNVLG